MPNYMEQILRQAFIDAEAYEMMKAYHVDTALAFEFKDRQDDFYITLITRMMNSLEQLETVEGEEVEKLKLSYISCDDAWYKSPEYF